MNLSEPYYELLVCFDLYFVIFVSLVLGIHDMSICIVACGRLDQGLHFGLVLRGFLRIHGYYVIDRNFEIEDIGNR